jgi:hypothetical protein
MPAQESISTPTVFVLSAHNNACVVSYKQMILKMSSIELMANIVTSSRRVGENTGRRGRSNVKLQPLLCPTGAELLTAVNTSLFIATNVLQIWKIISFQLYKVRKGAHAIINAWSQVMHEWNQRSATIIHDARRVKSHNLFCADIGGESDSWDVAHARKSHFRKG